MSFKLEEKEKYTLILMEAEKLDSTVSPLLKSEIVMVNTAGHRNIIINMSTIRYCDSSGLSAILVGNRLCNNSNGCLVICGVQDPVMKLITISQLDTILNIAPTSSEAEDLLYMHEVEKGLDEDENKNQ